MDQNLQSSPKATTAQLFVAFSRTKLLVQYWPRLRGAVESLTDDQVWFRPNPACNSIGNLLLHLNGNVRQWMIDSFNGSEDRRDRPAEFKASEMASGAVLLERLGQTLQQAASVLARLSEDDLLATFEIQGYTVSGLDAVYQVVEHFGLHYGQILYVVKMLEERDLGFYRELSKTGRAS